MANSHFVSKIAAIMGLLLMMAGYAVTSSAQTWTASTPADGGTYYMYNVGMRGFLIGGHGRAMLAPAPIAGQTVTLEQDGDNASQFRIDTHNLRANGKTDQWMVENWDDDWVYIDVAKSHTMHMPWLFTEVDGLEKVYHITIVGGTDNGRRLEMDSRNNGVPDLNNRAGVNMYTRSTGPTSYGGNLVAHNNEWMLVTPADYEASLVGTTDITARVGTAQADWTGSSEFGNDVKVTTADGRTTGIPAFYGTSAIGDKITQTVTGIDNGIYEVKVFAHSHNERADYGTAAPGSSVTGYTDVAYVFAESGETRVQTWIGARGRDPLGWTLAEFHTPYTISDVVVKNGQIKIGLALAQENKTQWQAIQIYSLVRTGDLPLTEKIEAYEAALSLARTTAEDTGLPAGFRAVLQTVIDANDAADTTSEASLDAATAALNNAVVEAETSRLPYARYNAVKADVELLDDDKTTYSSDVNVDVSAADAAADAATTIAEIDAAIPLLTQAALDFINAANVKPGTMMNLTRILLVNPDFENGTTGWTAEGEGTWRNMLASETVGYGAEFYHGTRDIHQDFTDLPLGRYMAAVQATWRDAQTSALYLTTATGTQQTQVKQLVPNNDVTALLTQMQTDPDYARITVDNNVTDGTLRVGLKEKAVGDGDCWTLFDNFQLFYIGLDYTAEEARLEAALVAAETFASEQDIPGPVKARLNALRSHYDVTAIEASGTYAEVVTLFAATIAEIENAVADAQAYVAPYAAVGQMLNAVENIFSQTDAYTPDVEAESLLQTAAEHALTDADEAEDLPALQAIVSRLRQSIATFVKTTNIPGQYFDLTSLLINPGFETSRNEGWTYSHDGGAFNWISGDGFHCVEFFNCTYNLSQTLDQMPAGTYKVQVNGHYRPNNEFAPSEHLQTNVDGYLYLSGGTPVPLQVLRDNANDIPAIHQQMDNGEYLNEACAVTVEDAPLTLGIRCDTQRRLYRWTLVDDFRLFYTVSDDALFLQPYNVALAAAQAVDTSLPMNAEERDLLLEAIAADETLNKNNTATLQDATFRLQQATATALVSQAAYAEASTALDRIDAEMALTNVVTAEATAVFQNYRTAYEAGFFTDEEAEGLMRRTFRDGVNRELGNAFDEYLLSAWKEGDVQMRDYDGVLYINTWSTEPDVEGFTYPFYEFADGYNASTVAHTLTATVEDVEPGDYEVEIWARTRIKVNGEYQIGAYPEGITFQLNGGEAIELQGEEFGSFRADHYTVGGTVGDDRQLRLVLTIPASEQGTWLSFRNVHYALVELPTGIDEVQSTKYKVQGEGVVYDLQGRKVADNSALPKGLYIINGKKVLIK